MTQILSHENQYPGEPCVVALGTFDGVHLGHRALLGEAVREARRRNLPSVVWTFSTHPMTVFAPGRVPRQLETLEEKTDSLRETGVDFVILRPFTREFADLTPQAFLSLMEAALHPRMVVAGFNYTFGKKGAGTAQLLRQSAGEHGFETLIVPAVQAGGEAVSSTRIRDAIREGDMAKVRMLMGKPYALGGRVVHGRHLASLLGFPTANLDFPREKEVPLFGVYAALAALEGKTYPAVVNIGVHPTVPGDGCTVEAALMGYDGGDFYGKTLTLRLMQHLRREEKFASLSDLAAQVRLDRERAMRWIAENCPMDGRKENG